jgi:hypothetical protein
MKTTVTKYDFRTAFHNMERYDQFGYEALGLLFDYFEEIDSDMELDVIAICCDYAVDTVEDIAQAYSIESDDVMDYLQDHTSVVGECSDGRIVYCSAF